MFLVIWVYTLWTIIELKYINPNSSVRSIEEHFTISIFFLFVGIILWIFLRSKLKMKKIKIEMNNEELNRAIRKTSEDLKWKIRINNQQVMVAHRDRNQTGSWGEMITIIKGNKLILVNSICDPTAGLPTITTWGMNKKNINQLLLNLDFVKDEIKSISNEQKLT